MKLNRESIRRATPKKSPQHATTSASEALETQLLEMYHSEEARSRRRTHPLVDIVNPQPQAFYAYLRMPKAKKPVQPKRISRRRPGRVV